MFIVPRDDPQAPSCGLGLGMLLAVSWSASGRFNRISSKNAASSGRISAINGAELRVASESLCMAKAARLPFLRGRTRRKKERLPNSHSCDLTPSQRTSTAAMETISLYFGENPVVSTSIQTAESCDAGWLERNERLKRGGVSDKGTITKLGAG
ncbi:hypothetical protein TRVL_01396 [Trypanosoma vivax]|nr:hypothetical protein TRVL_01396 [Trypanosoma vivax]